MSDPTESMTNPYASPEADLAVQGDQGDVRLYSPRHVAWATFLGSPLAGCVLMGLNFFRFGDSSTAWMTIGWGTLGTIVMFVVAFFLPDNFPSVVIPAATTFGMFHLAKSLQGARYERHLAEGGQKASGWAASGIAVLCLVVVLAAMLAVVMVMPEDAFVE